MAKSKGLRAPKSLDYLNAQWLIDFLAKQNQPASWQQCTQALPEESVHAIRKLRQILRGMLRNGQIEEPSNAFYILASQEKHIKTERQPKMAQGKVEVRGAVLNVAQLPILSDAKRGPFLRAGDEVTFQEVDERASIVSVVSRSPEPIVGTINLDGRTPTLNPLGRLRLGMIRIVGGIQGAKHGQTATTEIVDTDHRGVLVEIRELMRPTSVLAQAIDSTLASLQIPQEWPEDVLRDVARLPKSVRPSSFPNRQDLTDLPLVTIDGATARDFDDAVFAQSLGGRKGWRLLVAIADVAHYVKPNQALDREALQRATSVYLPEQVVPMLPEALSNELCSLKPHVPRLALVCDMQISSVGKVKNHSFYEAVICSSARLTYHQVQDFIDHQTPLPVEDLAEVDPVSASVNALYQLLQKFLGAREKRGGLDFESREGQIEIVNGRVAKISQTPRLQAHQLIEEAMIAANVSAAECIEAAESRSLFRVHEPPEAMKLEDLRQDLRALGLSLPDGVPEPKQYKVLLEELAQRPNGWMYQQLVLRSLQQAVYTPHNKGHFGLALEGYAHFTSPIRRYPDLLVHRAIKAIITKGKDLTRWVPSLESLEVLGEQCSHNERRAESAAWKVDSWLKCDWLLDRVGETLPGTVVSVVEFGLFIELDGYYIQWLLHVSELGQDFFRLYRSQQALIGERSSRRFRLGDRIDVAIVNVEPSQGKIELKLPLKAQAPQGQGRDQGRNKKARRNGAAGTRRGRPRV